MPRAEVGTPKWLANKMRAKGLQRLRWYCQMCEKQCRDENGFKCHRTSEGHQRMMQVFMNNPHRFMDDFSREFEATFMQLMRTRYCRTRVLANSVYCEMIADKQHIHMNSTIWVTLSEFVQYLGKSGKCKIDYTPKGWYLEYIDREKIEREKKLNSQIRRTVTAEEKAQQHVLQLVNDARDQCKYKEKEEEKDMPGLRREECPAPIRIALGSSATVLEGEKDLKEQLQLRSGPSGNTHSLAENQYPESPKPLSFSAVAASERPQKLPSHKHSQKTPRADGSNVFAAAAYDSVFGKKSGGLNTSLTSPVFKKQIASPKIFASTTSSKQSSSDSKRMSKMSSIDLVVLENERKKKQKVT